MFGIILTAVGSFIDEAAVSLSKWAVSHKKEPFMVMGFLNILWTAAFFWAIVALKGEFAFNMAALPLFLIRAVFEIMQFHMGILATVKSERSAVGFLMILTVPLMLASDTVLGYEISSTQIYGIAAIVTALVVLFINHGIEKKGAGYAIFIALNPVITISIFKYSITHYNAVEVEQSLMFALLALYAAIMSFVIHKENPFKYLLRPVSLAHSIMRGVGGVFHSFAYAFAPASIITTTKRASTILATIVSGNVYFHEKHLLLKLFSFSLIIAGIVLLVV